MSDETMPVAEAAVNETDERFAYELAFHVLPTVAEGEVVGVFDAVKAHIINSGAEIFDEEAPERFDLAYEIEKHIDGKNRKFTSAYFSWIRFKAESSVIEGVLEQVDADSNVLRHLLIKLSRVEEEHPFYFHEALASQKQVTTVEESAVVPDVTTAEVTAEASSTEDTKEAEATAEPTETTPEVDESKLDEALEKEETDTK